ncbi:MAG: hypothetical protein WC284_12120 [Candidimonas sp.]
MNINLRKASRFQQLLTDEISKLTALSSVNVNVDVFLKDSEIVKLIEDEQRNLENRLRQIDLAEDALYRIRKKVSEANQKSGLSDLMADDAKLRREKSRLESLSRGSVISSSESIFRKVASHRERMNEYSGNNISVSVATEQIINFAKDRLKSINRDLTSIGDKMIEKNIQTTITLDADIVEVLRTLGIVD